MNLSAAGLSGNAVNQVFFFLPAICLFLLGLITFLMVYFVIRYRKEHNPRPVNREGNFWLEIGWTVPPILLVLVMFYYGMTGQGPPSGAQLYEVKGWVGGDSIDGSPRVGPAFKGFMGKSESGVRQEVERRVVVDEVIRSYIRHPNVDVVKGFPPIMPHVELTDAEMEAIVKHLATLKG
jgi:heme/copper-type cytochrome/quinol oxidase subunit 2